MENEMLTYFCWFAAGALSYKILSSLLALGNAIELYNKTLNGCIVMLSKVDEQKLIVMKQAHVYMKEQGLDKEEIEEKKSADIENHYIWRELMIKVILISCPDSIKNNLKFKDWKSAMQLLNK